MKVWLITFTLLLLLIITLLVGAQNEQMVSINYLLARAQMSVAALMAVLLSIGFVLGFLAFSLVWIKLKWQITQLKRKINTAKSE